LVQSWFLRTPRRFLPDCHGISRSRFWRAAVATPICRTARSSSGGILAIVGDEKKQSQMSRHWAFVVLMLVASPLRLRAQGDPPYFTDDTGTPGDTGSISRSTLWWQSDD
jgi:hypothetical protein